MTRLADTYPSDVPAQYGVFATNDIDSFEQAITPWDAHFRTLGSRPFSHRKNFLITPWLIIYRETFGSAIRALGVTPANMLAFTVPERTGERTRYWNRKVTHEHIPLSDSSWGVDAVFDAGQTHWMVLANKQMLQHQLCEEQFDQLHAAAAGRFLCITPAQSDALTNWLSRLVTGRPAQHRALHTVGPGHAIEQAFAIKLADLLWGNSQARPRPAAGTRARGLKRALDRLRSAPLDSVNFPELCESAGVSRRTLEYAFRDQLGMSPQQFLRLRRLHRVRRELMWASEASTTVTQLAHAHGFVDLGRFAGAYFSRFGERPSQTLRGSPPERMLPAHHLLWNSPG